MLRLFLSAAVYLLPSSATAQALPDSPAVVPVLAPLIGHPGSELADGITASRRRRKTGWARSSGGCIAVRGSFSRSTSISGR